MESEEGFAEVVLDCTCPALQCHVTAFLAEYKATTFLPQTILADLGAALPARL